MKKPFISIISAFTGALLGAGAIGKVTGESLDNAKRMSDKHLQLFLMMNQWVRVRQEGKTLADYFEKNGYKRIAIYGMSHVGETLANELRDTGITVAYGIDKRAASLYMDFNLLTMDDGLEEVDAIVVTAITYFSEIEKQLSAKVRCSILSLEDILFEV